LCCGYCVDVDTILKAYAELAGKARSTLKDKVYAFEVMSVAHMRHESAKETWRNLAEIHSSPEWLWPAGGLSRVGSIVSSCPL